MSEPLKTSEEVNVVVELGSRLERFADPRKNESKALKSYVRRYVDDLVADLAVPAKISLTVGRSNGENGFALNPYRVSVNGVKCRLALPAAKAQDVEAKELATSITRAVCDNRELVITTELSENIREGWSSEGKRYLPRLGLPEEAYRGLLAALVCRGFRIDRGRGVAQTFRELKGNELSARKCFEEAVSGLDTTAIKVLLRAGAKPQSSADDKPIEEMFEMMRDGLFYELGVVLPKVTVDTAEDLEENEFRFQLNDLRFPPVPGLAQDQFLVNDTVDRLALLKVEGKEAINPANGNECAIVQDSEGASEKCLEAGLTTWGPAGFIVLSLAGEITRNAGVFLTTGVVEYSMSQLRQVYPAPVDAALKRFGKVTLTRILRDLLDEGLSIRDLRGILEGLLSINGTTDVDLSKYIVFFPGPGALCPVTKGKTFDRLDAVDYSDCVRMSLRRYISHKYTRGGNTLVVYLIDPQIEKRIGNVDEQQLTPEEREQLIEAIFGEVGSLPPTAQTPVLLTTFEIRKALRNLIEKEFPRLPVVCYRELSPDMNIQPIARISWEVP